MIGGTLTLALTNANVTLTADQARDLTIRCTGTISANIIITTPGLGFYFVDNATTGSFTVTLQYTGGVGGTVVVPQGFSIPVIVDATNGVRVPTGVSAGTVTRYGLDDALSIHGADIASAGTTNLETATGNLVDVTGTTTITAITLSEGHERTVRFTGILTLTNGASLVLPGGANIVTAAGDYAVFRGYAAGVVRCTAYQRAAAAPNAAASDTGRGPIEIAVQSEMEAASSTTVAVTPGRQHFHPGHPKAGGNLNGSASPAAFRSGDYGMGAVTDNGTGDWTVAFDTAFADTNYWAALAGGGSTDSQPDFIANLGNDTNTAAKTTSSIVLAGVDATSGGREDADNVHCTFWGDYA
jgi:hypothetical protein